MQTTKNCTETTASKVETDPAKINSHLDKTRNWYSSWFAQNFTFLSVTQFLSLFMISAYMNLMENECTSGTK